MITTAQTYLVFMPLVAGNASADRTKDAMPRHVTSQGPCGAAGQAADRIC